MSIRNSPVCFHEVIRRGYYKHEFGMYFGIVLSSFWIVWKILSRKPAQFISGWNFYSFGSIIYWVFTNKQTLYNIMTYPSIMKCCPFALFVCFSQLYVGWSSLIIFESLFIYYFIFIHPWYKKQNKKVNENIKNFYINFQK